MIDDAVSRVRACYRDLLAHSEDQHDWPYAWRTELNKSGFEAIDFLMSEVVDAGKCVGCAACVTICPVDALDYASEHPVGTRADGCVRCVLCAEVCPVLRPQDKDLAQLMRYQEPVVENGYGTFSYALYTRAVRPEIRSRGQDGGSVSAMLLHALATGEIRGAILGDTEPEQRMFGRARLARSEDEVLSCAASRYTFSPNTLAFRAAMREGVKPLAVVGVPCQIDGLRLQQNSSISSSMAKWFRTNVAVSIGLFCSESFTRPSIERLAALLAVPSDQIRKMNIKGKVVVELDDGRVLTSSLKKYRQWARPACLYCTDYSAEHADIAMGGIGLDGWTFTLVRTEAGHRFLRSAIDDEWIETMPIDAEPKGQQLLEKLSAEKKLNKPHPAKMPTLAEREAMGHVDPKTFYTNGPGAPVKSDAGVPQGDPR